MTQKLMKFAKSICAIQSILLLIDSLLIFEGTDFREKSNTFLKNFHKEYSIILQKLNSENFARKIFYMLLLF